MKCIHCMKKAEVIHYGSSFCLNHFAKERLIRILPFKERKRLVKMSNEEIEKELDKIIKEKKFVGRTKKRDDYSVFHKKLKY